MNLLGPELVRDLVSLIQRAEADDGGPGARVHERRPGLLHLPRRPDAGRGVPAGGGEADRRGRRSRCCFAISARAASSRSRRSRAACAPPAASSSWPATCASRRASQRSSRQFEPAFGLLPGGGAAQHLTRLMGRARALEVMLSAERLRRRARGALRLDQPRAARRRARRSSSRSLAHRIAGSRRPATPRSRSASTRSRLRRPTISVATRTCSATASSARGAGASAAFARGLQTRDAEIDLSRVLAP